MGRIFSHRKYGHIQVVFTILVLITCILMPQAARCQRTYTAARFLLIAPDARGKSLGEGGSVFSTGAISTYYNPALLVTSRELSVEYNYCDYAPDLIFGLPPVKNFYLSSNYQEQVYFGMGYSRFSFGESERTDELGNSLGTYESKDYAFGLWAAMTFDPDNSAGIGFKYIKSDLGYIGAGSQKYDASSLALDIGILSRNLFPQATFRNENINYPNLDRLFRPERDRGFSLGISVMNLGKELKYDQYQSGDPLSKTFRLGAGYQAVDSEPIGIQLTVDTVKLLVETGSPFKKEWDEIAWSYGMELEFYYLVSFRMGKLFDRDSGQRFNTIGIGLGPEWLSLDYSKILNGAGIRTNEPSISLRCNISPRMFKSDHE